jgi:NAD(P)-dependent dehydrogenase (short-subunit alcohol dehydrogenase family)
MPRTPDYFAGKTIIITGAASGIGRATALIFAREHANVVCADVNEVGARETAAQVNGKGSQAIALKVDVTVRKDVDDMVTRALDAFGGVNFLFNIGRRRNSPRKVSRDRRYAPGKNLRPQREGHLLRYAGRTAAHA